MRPTNENNIIWPWEYNQDKSSKWYITDHVKRKKAKKRLAASGIVTKLVTNGEWLKTYKMPCLKGLCDGIVEVEKIGYRNGIMYVRCKKCGYIQQMLELPNN